MLSRQELWISVIAISIPALLYLIRDVIEEFREEDIATQPWKSGDKQRVARKPPAPWAEHHFLLIFVCLADLAILKALMK